MPIQSIGGRGRKDYQRYQREAEQKSFDRINRIFHSNAFNLIKQMLISPLIVSQTALASLPFDNSRWLSLYVNSRFAHDKIVAVVRNWHQSIVRRSLPALC